MYVRKFSMRYILKEQFCLNISRVISKSVRRELTFGLSVVKDVDNFYMSRITINASYIVY